MAVYCQIWPRTALPLRKPGFFERTNVETVELDVFLCLTC